MKVLVCGSDSDGLAKAGELLEDEGIEILSEDSPDALIPTLMQSSADLVLLDCDSTQVPAFDFCTQIKTHPDLFLVPVVVLSPDGQAEQVTKSLNLGATDCIPVPFQRTVFVARIWAALRTKGFMDQLLEHAGIDPFTNLASRAALYDQIEGEYDRRKRYGGEFSLLMCCIDGFSQMVDLHGRQAGGQVLREVAKVLNDQCRRNDFAARFTEDLFAIIAVAADAKNAATMAERVGAAVDALDMSANEEPLDLSLSIGIADTRVAETNEELIAQAEDAMKRARNAGPRAVELQLPLSETDATSG